MPEFIAKSFANYNELPLNIIPSFFQLFADHLSIFRASEVYIYHLSGLIFPAALELNVRKQGPDGS